MLKLFLADTYLLHPVSGYAYGLYNKVDKVCFILCVSPCIYTSCKIKEIRNYLGKFEQNKTIKSMEFLLLGIFSNWSKNSTFDSEVSSQNPNLKIVLKDKLFQVENLSNGNFFNYQVIIYENYQFISKSVCLSSHFEAYFFENWSKMTYSKNNSKALNFPKEHTLIEMEDNLVKTVSYIPSLFFSNALIYQKYFHSNNKLNLIVKLKKFFYIFISLILDFFALILCEGFKILIFIFSLFAPLSGYLFGFSAVLDNLIEKCQILHKLVVCTNKKEFITKKNISSSILIDIFLSLLFYCFLFTFDMDYLKSSGKSIIPFIEAIANQVELLIHWLMGDPIGLKLNLPLNQFLGKFFLHHVELWLEYLRTTLNSFSNLSTFQTFFYTMLSLSFLGLTFILAALSDIISLLTFHIFCFYMYAARLFQLQLNGIISLSRLFRGKKWNPLRSRVDTLVEGGEARFFAGTLVFAILFFLFPTMLLYYLIFTSLRLGVLFVQSSLLKIRKLLTFAPWFSLFSFYLFPLSTFNKVYFTWLEDDITKLRKNWSGKPLSILSKYVQIKFQFKDFAEVWKEASFKDDTATASCKQPSLLSSILRGHLIK